MRRAARDVRSADAAGAGRRASRTPAWVALGRSDGRVGPRHEVAPAAREIKRSSHASTMKPLSEWWLHQAAARGDLPALLAADPAARRFVNDHDPDLRTPLDRALRSPSAGPDTVRLLLEWGARLDVGSGHRVATLPLTTALEAASPEKLRVLLDAGADLNAKDHHGYDPVLRAAFGCDEPPGRRLEVLRILVSRGARLDGRSSYAESAVGQAAARGRYDELGFLLDAGADASPLRWTPLHHAAAFGSIADVESAIAAGVPLDARDRTDRNAWHVALIAGRPEVAVHLRGRGVPSGLHGAHRRPYLWFDPATARLAMVRVWLEEGWAPDAPYADDETLLDCAVTSDDVATASFLLDAGADVACGRRGVDPWPQRPLAEASSGAMIRRLLAAGGDPADLSSAARRTLLGLDPEASDEPLRDVSREEFERGRRPRTGRANPERIDEPFWAAMLRAGVSAYRARCWFVGGRYEPQGAVWCADRFGMSVTPLPDGRIVAIGGEHEDAYDPDFHIYNDVIVRDAAGGFTIHGYPHDVFPPTDFHTATLLDGAIFVIGGLGYHGQRKYGTTPVHRLDLETLRIEPVATIGDPPGWLYEHRADVAGPGVIVVRGGTRVLAPAEGGGPREAYEPNEATFALDVRTGAWRRL